MFKIIHFDKKYLNTAAGLLWTQYTDEMERLDILPALTLKNCIAIIETELNKKESHSLALLVNDQFAGYMISTIKADRIFGDKGWVNIGAWAIENHAIDKLGYVYEQIADAWMKKGIDKHIIMSFAGQEETIGSLVEFGFAKQQIHGLMNCGSIRIESSNSTGELVFRRSEKSDQEQINSFSRIIADYQSQSPCYAPAPEEYLLKLDEGFSTLTEDDEGDLYVVEKEGFIMGYQMYFPCDEISLLEPEHCTELAVSAVKKESRGQGAGFFLTEQALKDQITQRRTIFSTDWRCANLKSSRFWPRIGFKPIAFRFYRQIETI